ncbi:MAG TPA: glycoside hydrolase family 43 protein [Acidimicrobiales bacterium]|nr:glycoside hydrolase family 43 protein [Acidimicrobiales bacterium]
MGRAGRFAFSVGGTLALVGLICFAALTDVQSHTRLRVEHQRVATTKQELGVSTFGANSLTYAKGLDTSHLMDLENALASTTTQLTTNQQALATENTSAYLQGVDIGTLHTCLDGVQGALQQIQARNNAAATGDISSASAACLTLHAGSDSGMVYPFDFPDPYVLRVGSTYFAYATNSAEGNIQIIQSSDLSQWTAVGNALPKLAAWAAPGGTWAPSVLQIGGTYLLYYSAVVAGPGGGEECISVATATRPQGPFSDTSTAPLVCQSTLGGSIDPSPFVNADGERYLQWKSNGAANQPAGLWSEELNVSGTGFAAAVPTELLAAGLAWERGVIEAPDLVFSSGRYYLFYSGNNWNSADYAVGMATCTGPLGPCARVSSTPVFASDADLAGPGGATVFSDTAGALWMAFDAWVPGSVGYPHSRSLYVRRISLSGSQVLVASG